LPPLHVGVPPAGAVQAVVQSPQCCGSVFVLLHVPVFGHSVGVAAGQFDTQSCPPSVRLVQ
jgi:hypothetical protein